MNDTPLNLKNENICPYIGLSFDVQTAMENPSLQNYCHKAKPLSPPSLTHQREFCLNVTYSQCKVFSADVKKPIPPDLAVEPKKNRKRIPIILWFLIGIVLIGVIFIASGLFSTLFISPPPDKVTTSPTDVIQTIQIPLVEPTLENTVTLPEPTSQVWVPESTPVVETLIQPTTGLTPIPEFTEEPPHLLLTPFGIEQVFLLHRVTGGEDLIAIAIKYQTSVEAIRAVNYNMSLELWVDTVVIIMPNQTDVTGITPMTPLEITGKEKSVQELAAEYEISPDVLGAVNARSISYSFQIGEWVIIPHASPSPT